MKAKGKIGKILGEINPEAQRKRQNVAGHLLNPKTYNAEYFGHKIHYNQNEKIRNLWSFSCVSSRSIFQ